MSVNRDDLRNRECARVLRDHGFIHVSTRGSHEKWMRGKEMVIIHFRDVNRMIWRRLCKEHGFPLPVS